MVKTHLSLQGTIVQQWSLRVDEVKLLCGVRGRWAAAAGAQEVCPAVCATGGQAAVLRVDNSVNRDLMESLCQGETDAQEEKLGALNGLVAWTENGS